MKKLIFSITAFALIVGCSKQAKYFDVDYETVFENATKDNKMVFIYFYTNWGGQCKLFDDNIANDKHFKEYVSSNFYTAKLNAEANENMEIVEKYAVTEYPTFVLVKPKGAEIDRIEGLYAMNPKEFVALMKIVISGIEQLDLLKNEFFEKPDSIELFRYIIKEKLIANHKYPGAIELSEFALKNSNNIELKNEAGLFRAYSMLRKKPNPSPIAMINYVNKDGIDPKKIEWGYNELYIYYRKASNLDSIEYCLDFLVNIDSKNHFGYLKTYAEFLYKENRKIGLADSLTKEFTGHGTNHADHWAPYLQAHSCARNENKEKGTEVFDKWMEKHSKPGNFKENLWHYYYYVDFSLFYGISTDRVLEYAETIIKHKPGAEHKKRLAKIHFLRGNNDKATEILEEVKQTYQDPKKIAEIDDLMNEYGN